MNNVALPENLPAAHQRIITLEREVHFLKDKMALMQRQFFGRHSERRMPEVSLRQLSIFASGTEPEAEPKKETISYERHKPAQRRETGMCFPEHLEREVIELKGEEPQGESTLEWENVLNQVVTKWSCPTYRSY